MLTGLIVFSKNKLLLYEKTSYLFLLRYKGVVHFENLQ